MYDVTVIAARMRTAHKLSGFSCLGRKELINYELVNKGIERLEHIEDIIQLRNCDLSVLLIASRLYNVDLDWLCGGNGDFDACQYIPLSYGDVATLLEKTKNNVSKHIKSILESSDVSLYTLARLADVPVSAVRRVLACYKIVPTLTVLKLANCLQLPITWFIEDTVDKSVFQRNAILRESSTSRMQRAGNMRDRQASLAASIAPVLDENEMPLREASMDSRVVQSLLHGMNIEGFKTDYNPEYIVRDATSKQVYNLNDFYERVYTANAARHNILQSEQLHQSSYFAAMVSSDSHLCGVLQGITLVRAQVIAGILGVSLDWLCGKGGVHIMPSVYLSPLLSTGSVYERETRYIIGDRLYALREHLHYSIRDLAALTGVSRTTLSKLEKRNPSAVLSLHAACKIAAATGITLDDLCGKGCTADMIKNVTVLPLNKDAIRPRNLHKTSTPVTV